MKDANEKVKLSVEESKQVAGGFSFSGFNLSSFSEPTLQVYAQVASSLSSLKPVADSLSALQPVYSFR